MTDTTATTATTVFLHASLAAMLLAGCNPGGSGGGSPSGGSGGASAPPAASQSRVDDSDFLASAAHAAEGEGQITLNNPWTAADRDGNEVGPVDWKTTRDKNFHWQATTYTTLVSQYRERRRQCERDSQVTFRQRYPDFPFGPNDDPDQPICHPVLVTGPTCLAVFNPLVAKSRYGYWCGHGHPPHAARDVIAEQPLDAVDFCCMLHDAQVWGQSTGTDNIGERGMTMCLYMATQYPDGIVTWDPQLNRAGGKLPEVERARQWWYDCAAGVISGDQFDDAPAPVVRR